MKIGKFNKYRDYIGSIEYSSDDDVLFGRLLNIGDLVYYEAEKVEELEEEFHKAVDDYIKFKMELKGEIVWKDPR